MLVIEFFRQSLVLEGLLPVEISENNLEDFTIQQPILKESEAKRLPRQCLENFGLASLQLYHLVEWQQPRCKLDVFEKRTLVAMVLKLKTGQRLIDLPLIHI